MHLSLGNHDNREYEDDWGERYQGLLTKDAKGKTNYDDQANQNIAKNLKGRLLLAHGTMDELRALGPVLGKPEGPILLDCKVNADIASPFMGEFAEFEARHQST